MDTNLGWVSMPAARCRVFGNPVSVQMILFPQDKCDIHFH
jgi:hypothetical protein